MGVTAQSTVIVDVNINQADALTKARALNDTIVTLKDSQDKLKASGLQVSTTYVDNAQKIQQLTQQQKAYIAISNTEATSNTARAAQYKLIVQQLNQMTEAERLTTDAGKALTAQAKSLKTSLDEAGKSVGNNTGAVGSYEQAITKVISQQSSLGGSLINSVKNVNSLAGAFGDGAATAGGFIAVTLAVITAVGGIISHFTDLTAASNKLDQRIAATKATFNSFLDSIGTGVGFSQLAADMKKASDTALELTAAFQDLARQQDINLVKNAELDTKIAQLNLKLRRDIINKDAEAQAQDIVGITKSADDRYKITKSGLDKEYELTVRAALNTQRFTDAQRKEALAKGVDYLAELDKQTQRKILGVLPVGGIIGGQKALDNIAQIQAQQQANEKQKIQTQDQALNREERAQNAREAREAAAAAKADAKRKELQQHLDQINADRVKSELDTANSILTIRQKEFADIDADINKREILYRKYGQSTVQLEKERLARISALEAKFREEDLSQIQSNVRSARQTQITSEGDPNKRAQQQQDFDSTNQLQDLDKQILGVSSRVALGERGLEQLLQSFANRRTELIKAFNIKDAQLEQDRIDKQKQLEQAGQKDAYESQVRALEAEQAQNDARLQMNAELVQSYSGLAGEISQAFGKNTAAGKVAIAAQKAFAIAEVIINGERAKAAITARYALLELQAASIPFAGEFLVIGLKAAEAVELGQQTAKEIFGVASILATSIGSFATGGRISGPGTGTSDSVLARVSNGETIINAKSSQMFLPELSAMNVAGGGRAFATGGQIGGTTIPNISNQISARNAVAQSISDTIKNQQWYVAVTDINRGQDQLAQVEAAGNF